MDDLIAEAESVEAAWSVALAPDTIAAIDQAPEPVSRSSAALDAVLEEYVSAGAGASFQAASRASAPPHPEPADLPALDLPVDAESIERELGLKGQDSAGLQRIRRAFALANHPDRLAPYQRDRAVARMQIANMLIDEAMKRLPA